MRKVLVVIAGLLALTGLAGAQVPKGNLFFGYSYASADIGAGNRTNLNGWNGSLEGKLFPFVGIVADVSGHYGSQDFAFGMPRRRTLPRGLGGWPCVDRDVRSAGFRISREDPALRGGLVRRISSQSGFSRIL